MRVLYMKTTANPPFYVCETPKFLYRVQRKGDEFIVHRRCRKEVWWFPVSLSDRMFIKAIWAVTMYENAARLPKGA